MDIAISKNRIGVELLSIFLLFSGFLSDYVHAFQYLDEFVSIICLIAMLGYFTKSRVSVALFVTIITTLLLLGIGLISTHIAKIQENQLINFLDALAIFKFIPVFWGGLLLSSRIRAKDLVWKLLSRIARVFILVAFVCAILNVFVDIHMYTDVRFGIRAFNFVYARVGGLYMGCATMLIVQLMDIYYSGAKRLKSMFLAMTLIVMCSTLRTRAFVFAVVFLLGYLFVVQKHQFRLRIWHVVVLIGAILSISYSQIRFYFIDNDTQARNVLLKYGLETAQTYFPWGSGFATYGTNAAKSYYSPLYLEYGFSDIYGLGKTKATYLTDTYWPAIIAEFGFFGAILMVIIIGAMVWYTYEKVSKNPLILFATMYGFGVIIISSFATASFMTSVGTIFLIAIAVSETLNR